MNLIRQKNLKVQAVDTSITLYGSVSAGGFDFDLFDFKTMTERFWRNSVSLVDGRLFVNPVSCDSGSRRIILCICWEHALQFAGGRVSGLCTGVFYFLNPIMMKTNGVYIPAHKLKIVLEALQFYRLVAGLGREAENKTRNTDLYREVCGTVGYIASRTEDLPEKKTYSKRPSYKAAV